MTISKIVEWKTQSRKTRKVAIEHTAEATDRTAYLDGELKWSIDTSDIPGGKIGLGGYKGHESQFDDVRVYGPEGAVGGVSAVSSKGKLTLTWGEIKGL